MYKLTKEQLISAIVIFAIIVKINGLSIIQEIFKIFITIFWSFLGIVNRILLLNNQSVLSVAFGDLIVGSIVTIIVSTLDIRVRFAGIAKKVLLLATSTIVIAVLNELSKLVFR